MISLWIWIVTLVVASAWLAFCIWAIIAFFRLMNRWWDDLHSFSEEAQLDLESFAEEQRQRFVRSSEEMRQEHEARVAEMRRGWDGR
jgi:hypothetical protein